LTVSIQFGLPPLENEMFHLKGLSSTINSIGSMVLLWAITPCPSMQPMDRSRESSDTPPLQIYLMFNNLMYNIIRQMSLIRRGISNIRGQVLTGREEEQGMVEGN
jgi:hypothetical protein